MTHRTVADVMTTDVVFVSGSATFHQIAEIFGERGVSAVPVVVDGRVAGVVSEADLLKKMEFADGEDDRDGLFEKRSHRVARHKANARLARDLMTEPAVTVTTGTSVVAAARLMDATRVKRLPVLDEHETLVGIVSRHDLVKVFLRTDDEIRDEVLDHVFRKLLWIPPAEVEVTVDGGVVTLEGSVEQQSLQDLIHRLVRSVDGVVAIVDRLNYRFADEPDTGRNYYRPLV
jgi:CBS domain-containing protein/nitrate reductase NapAB chaperone NapD